MQPYLVEVLEMVKVSIIIPVHNSEQYLGRCLDSLINQSLKEIEIICIDDKSTDHSLEILQKIEKQDKRVKIIANPKNYGAGISRNFGLDISSGEYIHFVDSDDFLQQNALEQLYMQAKEQSLDMCFHKMKIITSGKVKNWQISKGIIESYPECYKGTELLSKFIENNDFFYYPCSALFSKELLIQNNCFFKPLLIGEGGEFVLHALIYAKRVAVNNEEYYRYCINPSSITQKNNDKSILQLGSIIQYITVLKNAVHLGDDMGIYKYLRHQHIKISNNMVNSSNEEIEKLKAEMPDEFSKYVLDTLLLSNKKMEIQIPKECREVVLNYRKVILYGAGNIVKAMLNFLNENNIILQGIAVSDKRNNPENLYGHSVYEISELKKYAKECLVIVALKSKYHADVKKLLEIYSFENVAFIDIDCL